MIAFTTKTILEREFASDPTTNSWVKLARLVIGVPYHIFTNFCNNRINVVIQREILINKNALVFYVNFRLETNIFILFISKHAKFWLISKSLLVRIKNYKGGFVNVIKS